jgi:acyl carrier protein
MNVEDAFGVDLPLDAVYSLVDLGALADLIESALSNTGSK